MESTARPSLKLPPPTPTTGGAPTTAPAPGLLRVIVLSAYDLPDRDPPLYVRMTIDNTAVTDETTAPEDTGGSSQNPIGTVVQTGPPVQRHKDRNSFKFHARQQATAAAPGNSDLVVRAPLSELYRQVVNLTVAYADSDKELHASYKLNQLMIQETTWLILNLSPKDSSKQITPVLTLERPPSTSFDEEDVPPTLRLQMTLKGPYRTEIAAAMKLLDSWLRLVDRLEDQIKPLVGQIPEINIRWMLIPTAPLLALTVVAAPIVVGVCLVFLPLVLPLLVLVVAGGTTLSLVLAFLYASTRAGRLQVASACAPLVQTVLSTPTGQQLVYQTGPRPTPVRLCKTIFPSDIWGKLALSLWIDLLGSASYLLPLVGEGADVVWAPLQTVFVMALYDTEQPNLKYLSFVEEILPLTDVVPTATLGWFNEFGWPIVLEQVSKLRGSLATMSEEAQPHLASVLNLRAS